MSVDDRLPEEGETVIICTVERNICTVDFESAELCKVNRAPYLWWIVEGGNAINGQDVTHWMKLPMPPAESEVSAC